jgi:hypothetical protein
MNDLSEFEQRWLSAARAEEPPPEVVSRIERALGIGAPAPLAAPSSNAAAAAKPGLSGLKIAALSALGVGGAVGLVLLLSRPSSPPPIAAPPAVEPPPVVEHAASPHEERGPAPPTAAIAPAAERPAGAAGPGALRDEIALIDGARAALAAGAPDHALTLLERYRARHPHGMLLPEALAMRIEAIDRSGDHARARSLARAFLAEYPHSPLAQRVAHIGAR